MEKPTCEAIRILQDLGNAAVATRVTGNQLAKALKVSPVLISCWKNGKNKPSEENKLQLARKFGVPLSSWGQPPVHGGPIPDTAAMISVRRSTDRKQKVARAAPIEPEYDDEIPDDGPVYHGRMVDLDEPNSRNGCLELIKSLRSARRMPGVLPSERVKLASAETRALALLSKLDSEAELSEERIIKHPKWQKMRKAIVDTIIQYPEAAKAVLVVLKNIEASDGN